MSVYTNDRLELSNRLRPQRPLGIIYMTSKSTFRIRAVALAALAVGSVGTASAVPMTWVDDRTTNHYVASGSTYNYTHNITDGATGFRSGVDSIISAYLTIWLQDDAQDSQESVRFRFDGSSWSSSYNVDNGSTFSISGLVSRLTDGFLTVGLRASGDFIFDRSYQVVRGDRVVGGSNGGGTSVPEPGTLMLFGLGLLGAGVASRRRRGPTA